MVIPSESRIKFRLKQLLLNETALGIEAALITIAVLSASFIPMLASLAVACAGTGALAGGFLIYSAFLRYRNSLATALQGAAGFVLIYESYVLARMVVASPRVTIGFPATALAVIFSGFVGAIILVDFSRFAPKIRILAERAEVGLYGAICSILLWGIHGNLTGTDYSIVPLLLHHSLSRIALSIAEAGLAGVAGAYLVLRLISAAPDPKDSTSEASGKDR